jgi:mannose-6-phosphate isomerase-like protein (cupin superfamily)
MVNEIVHQTGHPQPKLVHGDKILPPDPLDPAPGQQDLFLDLRARILVTHLDPAQTTRTVCHIHASKQITVLDGYAEVEIPDDCIKLFEGQSAHIPNGIAHKILNSGKIPLKYVEIRTGPYVMDDDLLD